MPSSWTFETLYQSTIRFKPWRKSYAHNPKVGLMSIIPFVGTKSVLFQGYAYGLTQKAIHKQNLLFTGVDIIKDDPKTPQEEKPNLTDYIKVDYKGETYYVQKIDPRKHKLSIRCSCCDFFFRFAWENHSHGCLYGTVPRPYKRKTVNRPPVNPLHYSGMCKHVYNFYTFLRSSGFTVEQGYYR